MPFTLAAAAAGMDILGGLGGLFGRHSPSIRDQIVAKARGARAASEQFGFNPLTMLQASAGVGPASGGTPPLASIDAIAAGLHDLDPEVQADKERQRQIDQFNLDRAEILLDQARSGVLPPQTAAQSVGRGPSPLGKTSATVFPSGTGVPNGLADQGLFQAGDFAPPAGRGLGFFGFPLKPSPGNSDAQDQENRYGDAVSWVGGAGNLVADTVYTYGPGLQKAWQDKRAAYRESHRFDGVRALQDRREVDRSAPVAALKYPSFGDIARWLNRPNQGRKYTQVPHS